MTEIRLADPGLAMMVQVPAGGAGCASRVRSRVEASEHATLYLRTVVDSNQADYCTETALRTASAGLQLRGRALVVNQEAWKRGPGDTFVRCSTDLGCHPPKDRCDPAWTDMVTHGIELPPEQRVEVLACSGRWLVVDVDAVVTGCQSVDGSTPPAGCAGEGVHRRLFAELDKKRTWQVVGSGTAAGCAEVHAQVPAFPRRLCEDLPAG